MIMLQQEMHLVYPAMGKKVVAHGTAKRSGVEKGGHFHKKSHDLCICWGSKWA